MAIAAWRVWVAFPRITTLASQYNTLVTWQPNKPLKARCGSGGFSQVACVGHAILWGERLKSQDAFTLAARYVRRYGHHTPMPWSNCGIYAVKRGEDALHAFPTPHHMYVLGRVMLWGEIVEHEDGYRAEYAQIIALAAMEHPELIEPHKVSQYADRYDVPVIEC